MLVRRRVRPGRKRIDFSAPSGGDALALLVDEGTSRTFHTPFLVEPSLIPLYINWADSEVEDDRRTICRPLERKKQHE